MIETPLTRDRYGISVIRMVDISEARSAWKIQIFRSVFRDGEASFIRRTATSLSIDFIGTIASIERRDNVWRIGPGGKAERDVTTGASPTTG